MRGLLLSAGILTAIVALSGCRMCGSPYDYCGPVPNDDCGGCSFVARRGSNLEGGTFCGEGCGGACSGAAMPMDGAIFESGSEGLVPAGENELPAPEPVPDPQAFQPSYGEGEARFSR